MTRYLFFVFLLLTVVSSKAQLCFNSSTYGVGTNPYCITKGDFNSDNSLDLIITNTSSNNFTLLFNNGNGSFSSQINYQLSAAPLGVCSDDFNSDGKLDLAITCTSDSVKILLGNGMGGFGTPVSFQTASGPRGILSSDLNNDGKKDLAVANYNSHSISILLGNGNGTFNAATNFTLGLQSVYLAIGDFNNDGNKDLASANISGGGISILIGDGTGNYLSPYTLAYSGGNATCIITKDFNVDGNLDLIVTNSSSVYTTIFLGDGSGYFNNYTNFSAGYDPYFVSCDDFNGDSKIDLAVANMGSNRISIVYGNGNGTFSAPMSFTTNTYPTSITSGDFNNDGKMDVAVSNMGYGTAKVFLNDYFLYIGVTASAANLCKGTSTEIVASGVISYTWSTGATTNSITETPSVTKIYTVTGTDANNCVSTATMQIVVNQNPIINLNSAAICEGKSFTITPSGASTYTYSGGSDVVSPNVSSNYTVTGEDSNNCIGTATMQISVNQNPTIAIVPSTNSICIGSSVIILASGANTYTWNTGTTLNITIETPTLTTTYTVTGTDLNNCSNSQTISVTVDNTCQDVWPGDANSDGIADNLDVLELGLHYTQTSAPRASTSNLWQSYYAANWGGTITNGKNLNHSNCNGDGVINDDDTLAIFNNYNLTHTFKPNAITTTSAQISLVPDQSSVAKGTWGTSSIYLGEAATAINTINGVAFTVNYDNTLLETDSVWIEYPTSFINATNQNLKFRKRDFTNGKLFTATTHTTSGNVNGYGKIATLHYKIKSSLTTDNVLNISIAQANQSDASGLITPLTAGSATLMAIDPSVGLNELTNGNYISIRPNPTNGALIISSTTELQKIEVMAITGQLLMSEVPSSTSHVLHLDHLVNGVYFVNLYQNNHIVKREKIILHK